MEMQDLAKPCPETGRTIPMRDCEGGFSLVELLVVVIIIGILAAIAIPTYIGQREQAYAAAVQSDLRNAATAATACSAANDGLYVKGAVTCNIETLRADYDFASSENVTITSAVVTADRWAANANYQGRDGTEFYFDTDDDSQVKSGEIGD